MTMAEPAPIPTGTSIRGPEIPWIAAFADPWMNFSKKPLNQTGIPGALSPVFIPEMLHNLAWGNSVFDPVAQSQGELNFRQSPTGQYADHILRGTELFPGGKAIGMGVIGALQGVKRIPKLFHGTQGDTDHFMDIIEDGFTKGQSSELNLPGTSASSDPAVSTKGFGGGNPGNVFIAEPQVTPSEVYNLSPWAYLTGKVPEAPEPGKTIYNKPNLFFNEAETFARRDKPWTQEEELTKLINAHTDMKIDIEDFMLQGKAAPEPLLKAAQTVAKKVNTLVKQRNAIGGVTPLKPKVPTEAEQKIIDKATKASNQFYVDSTLFNRKLIEADPNLGLTHPDQVKFIDMPNIADLTEALKKTKGNKGTYNNSVFTLAETFSNDTMGLIFETATAFPKNVSARMRRELTPERIKIFKETVIPRAKEHVSLTKRLYTQQSGIAPGTPKEVAVDLEDTYKMVIESRDLFAKALDDFIATPKKTPK